MYQGTTSSCKVILLENRDLESSLCKACCCCNAANASTCVNTTSENDDSHAVIDIDLHTYNNCGLLASLSPHNKKDVECLIILGTMIEVQILADCRYDDEHRWWRLRARSRLSRTLWQTFRGLGPGTGP